MKVAVDCSLLALAVVASLIIWGDVVGVREGSLICAVSTGYIIGFFFKVCPIWDRLFARVRGESPAADEPALS